MRLDLSRSSHRVLCGGHRPGTTCFVLLQTHHRPHEARAHHVSVLSIRHLYAFKRLLELDA